MKGRTVSTVYDLPARVAEYRASQHSSRIATRERGLGAVPEHMRDAFNLAGEKMVCLEDLAATRTPG